MKYYPLCLFFFLLSVCSLANDEQIDSLIEQANKHISENDSLEAYKNLRKLGKHKYYKEDSIQPALGYFKQCLLFANSQDSGITYTNIANCYWRMADYDRSMECYRMAYKLGLKTDDEKLQAIALNNIGFLYIEFGDHLKALEYHKLALETRVEINNAVGIGQSYSSISNDYRHLDSIGKALEFGFKALQIFDSIDDKLQSSNALNNLGNIYFDQMDYSKSLQFYRKSLGLRMEIDHKYLSLESNKNIAKVLIEQKKYNQAEIIAKESLKLAHEYESLKLIRTLNKYLYSVYEGKQEYRKALKHYIEYVIAKDSIFSRETRDKIEELEIKYQTEKKEHEIEMLNVKNNLNQELIGKQKSRIQYVISIAMVFLVLGLIVFSLLIQKSRAYKILLNQNLEIAKLQKQTPRKVQADNQEEVTQVVEEKGSQEISQTLEQKILNNLLTLVRKKKYYLNYDCTIDKMAKELNTNRQYLSQIINSRFQLSFTNFINQYRVEDSRALLSDDEYHKYTIEGIGKLVGFQSRSSFISAFKKHTGVTPSDFKKTCIETFAR